MINSNDFVFRETFVAQSDTYSVDFSAFHWSMRGQQVNFTLCEEPVDDKRESAFKLFVRLSTSAFNVPFKTMELTDEVIASTGESFIDGGSNAPNFQFDVLAQRLDLKPIANGAGRLGGFVSSDLTGRFGDIIVLAKEITNIVLLGLVAPTKSPCFLDTLHICSADKKQRYYRTIAHYDVSAPLNRPLTIAALVPMITLFAEGIRATSVFYRFLCFYKIVEQLIDRVGPILTQIGSSMGLDPLRLNGIVPFPDFDKIAPQATGKKFTVVRSDYQDKYRNVIAHFDLSSPIQPFSQKAEAEVQVASAVMLFAADTMLKDVHSYINELKHRGCSVETIDFDK